MVISLGISAWPVYHLPTFTYISEGDSQHVVIQTHASREVLPTKINPATLGVKITASAAAVMDKTSGIILWQQNADEVRSIASITKLMTALVFVEHNPGWGTSVTMEEKDEANGDVPNILRNETVTVKDLFYASLISSDNNATNALARSTGLSREEYLDLMNKKANNLGLKNTHFEDLTGLSDSNKSTALEILTLAKTAFDNPDIAEAVGQSQYSFVSQENKAHKVFSTNQLLKSYLDVIAGKTGYVTASGYCLVSEVQGESGQKIIGVVLGSDSNANRFQDLKTLLTWVLDNFKWS